MCRELRYTGIQGTPTLAADGSTYYPLPSMNFGTMWTVYVTSVWNVMPCVPYSCFVQPQCTEGCDVLVGAASKLGGGDFNGFDGPLDAGNFNPNKNTHLYAPQNPLKL